MCVVYIDLKVGSTKNEAFCQKVKESLFNDLLRCGS